MKINTIYKFGFFLMLAMNGVLIFLLLQKPQNPPKHLPNAHGASLQKKISKKLNLNEAQQAEYQTMAFQHREEMNRIEKEHKTSVKSYFETLKSPEQQNSKETLLNEIWMKEKQKLTLTYTHFEELKSMLNKKQAVHYEAIIDDILKVLLDKEKKMPPPPRD